MSNTPTAANILSSLGIKGATVDANTPGCVPVLNASGKISASLLPSGGSAGAVPALSDVVFVDPYTTVPTASRTGSASAPFKSIAEAAGNFTPSTEAQSARTLAFLLMPGDYSDSAINLSTLAPRKVFFIGLGKCTMTALTMVINGLPSPSGGVQTSVGLDGIYMAGSISITASVDITVSGRSYVHVLNGQGNTALWLSPEARVDSTNATTVSHLAKDSSVANTTAIVGKTVGDAVGRLGRRRIRVPNIIDDSTGPYVDESSSFLDIEEDSSSSFGYYDLRTLGRILVDSIQRLYSREQVVAESVVANTVVAETVAAETLEIDKLAMDGFQLGFDNYGYLVIADESSSSSS